MVKLAGIDLDGTLYNRRAQVSALNQRAVREWVAAGKTVAICSGRTAPRVAALLERLQVSGYRICLNGALVYGPTGQVLSAHAIDGSVVEQALQIAIHSRARIRFYTDRVHAVYCPGGARLAQLEQNDVFVASVAELHQLLARPDFTVFKFTLTPTLGYVPGVLLAAYQTRHLALHATKSMSFVYEFTAPGTTKLSGLRTVAQTAGTNLEHTLFIGDYLNDLEAVAGVGFGVAMANGHVRVRKAAKMVAPRNTKDGVAQVLSAVLTKQNK